MRVHLVHHAGAGSGSERSAIRSLIEAAGHTVVGAEGRDGGLGPVPGGIDLVAIAGGDGTVGSVLRSYDGPPRRWAIVPTGTANQIALSLGVPLDPAAAIAEWRGSSPVRFAMPAVSGSADRRSFAESIGVGLFGTMIAEAARAPADLDLDEARSRLAELALDEPTRVAELDVDGRRWCEDVLAVEVLNIAAAGPRVVLDPTCQAGDGTVGVVVLTEGHREQVRSRLARPVVTGLRHDRVPWPVIRGLHVRIGIDADAPVHVDDEPFSGERFVVHAAGGDHAELLVPRSRS